MGWRDTLDSLYKNRDWKAASEDERKAAVTDVIRVSAFGAAAVSVTPVPLADVVMSMPLQAAMVVAIGHIKGRDISRAESFRIARELTTVVGTHMLARQAFVALSRIIFPGMAGFLMAPWTFGVTWGMGRVAEMYFDDPDAPADKLKAAFTDALADAKKAFTKEAFMEFMKRAGKEAEEFAKTEKDSTPPPAGTTPPTPSPPPSTDKAPVVEAEWDEAPPRGKGGP